MYELRKKIILFAGDSILIVSSICFSILIRVHSPIHVFDINLGATGFLTITCLFCFYIFDLYNVKSEFRSYRYLSRLFLSIVMVASTASIVFYFIPSWRLGREVFLLSTFIISFSTLTWRLIYPSFIRVVKKPKSFAIIGTGNSAEMIYKAMSSYSNDGIRVRCFLDDDISKINVKIGSRSVIGPTRLLIDMAERGEVDCAVIATTLQMNPELLKTVTQSEMKGVAIYDMPTLYEELTGKIPVKHIPRSWMSYTALRRVRGDLYIRMKQIFDVVLSALGLVIALPLLVLVALAIKLDSRGPVFYRQKRVGLNGRQFDLIKLRSMTTCAESAGAKWAQENDTRITRIGRVLRKFRFDEIPQMWNVLKGEMSFIGPRPERPEFTTQLLNDIPFYALRHSIKPGITGWAQVNYGYGASVEDAAAKLQYDLFYIKNLSFFLDLHILLRTIRVVLFGRGAR